MSRRGKRRPVNVGARQVTPDPMPGRGPPRPVNAGVRQAAPGQDDEEKKNEWTRDLSLPRWSHGGRARHVSPPHMRRGKVLPGTDRPLCNALR